MANIADAAKFFRSIEQRLRSLESRQHPAPIVRFTNRSGVSIISGDIVVLDPVNDKSVILASLGVFAPAYVSVSNANIGDAVFCAGRGYGFIEVQCVGVAAMPGDLIVASQGSPRYAEVNNAAGPFEVIGISVGSKAAGITAFLNIEVY